MITFGLSVPVPTVDNSAAIAATMRRIAFEEHCAERALDLLSLPFVREDEVLQDVVNDHLLDCGERAFVASQDGYALFLGDGAPAPTQETWDALQLWEHEAIADDYVENDCRTGLWEANPWGDLVERNSLAFARHPGQCRAELSGARQHLNGVQLIS